MRSPRGFARTALLALATTTPLFVSDRGAAQVFVDHTVAAGLTTAQHTTSPFGTGLAAGDVDGDGDMDLIVPGQPGAPLRLYRNLGALQFRDDTAVAGLGNALGTITGVTLGDVDNDGDADLFACALSAPCALYINDGTGRFTEQAAARGIGHIAASYSASFGDYDRDGWLDLYVGNRDRTSGPGPGDANILYRNIGGGVFRDETQPAGVGDLGMTYAATFVDFDEDGWPDIVVANDKGARVLPNELYRNLGNGTFAAVGAQFGANAAIDGMGVDFADAFCDGGVDLMCSDSAPDHLFLAWHNGAYVDRTLTHGMWSFSDGWAVDFFDADNDGWQDAHVVNLAAPNSLFHNPAAPFSAAAAWPDVAAASGLALSWFQYTTVVADLDDDGRLDLCHRYVAGHPVLQAPQALGLLQNTGPATNWLKFTTTGTVSNRDGIGARVVVTTGSHVQRQWVRNGTGFLSSSDPRLHFGLGGAAQADEVAVLWPSGQQQRFTQIAANQIFELVEPSFGLVAPAQVGATTRLDLASPNEPGSLYAMVLAFAVTPRTSLGGGRTLPLALDALSGYSIVPGNVLLSQPLGALDATGRASSNLTIPNQPFLRGLVLYATAATFGPQGFPDVRTIFPTAVRIAIQ